MIITDSRNNRGKGEREGRPNTSWLYQPRVTHRGRVRGGRGPHIIRQGCRPDYRGGAIRRPSACPVHWCARRNDGGRRRRGGDGRVVDGDGGEEAEDGASHAQGAQQAAGQRRGGQVTRQDSQYVQHATDQLIIFGK